MTARRLAWMPLVAVALAMAGCASAPNLPPVTTEAGATRIPGKFVWMDLFTSDPEGAKAFYGGLFGWQFEPVAGTDQYTVIKHEGRSIGGILKVKPNPGLKQSSAWVASVSVEDVDGSARAIKDKGGKVHKGPLDVPGRGRGALVSDPQGGYFIVMRSASGDPADGREPAIGSWMWIDYCASRPGQAITFYSELLGWKQELVQDERAAGSEYYVFKQGGRFRAGLFQNPWKEVRSHWIPYVRVEDAAATAARAQSLGGRVAVQPSPDLRKGTTALIVDPSGAGLVLQKYPI